ncbi:DUF2946 domain-containing protein [Chitinilyticum piscinae]|uniref:DUF2946 domain-containing protein n=1 Tax=Chitinilyticum piscinae TaxID=2866724 RepID=A0A8J7FQ15_9NEIS|nr:DUF2946 domain-containing protein [Chitinilyticum piscinae]MBE9608541.1 DUF2946 domain-containing protein [Chitinilyticum piscinae]
MLRPSPTLLRPRAWLAMLAMLLHVLLPFAHAAAMARPVSPAWCTTAKSGDDTGSLAAPAQPSPAKGMLPCPLCAILASHATAPPPASLLPVCLSCSTVDIALAPQVSAAAGLPHVRPPPRGPPALIPA